MEHRWGYAPHSVAAGQYTGTGVPALLDCRLKLQATVPGDVIACSAKTIHGQTATGFRGRGDFRRLVLRFTGDDARYCLRRGEARDVIPGPHHPCSLQPGEAMRCDRFPQVWLRPDQ